jgi:hypothetical protein
VARRSLGRALAVLLLAAAAVVLLIAYPKPLFAHSVTAGRFTVNSDRQFDRATMQEVLAGVEQRLGRSPLDDPGATYDLYIANSAWRRSLFFTYARDAGGLTYYAISRRNVFLSGMSSDGRSLVAPDGTEMGGVRTLAYYIAHEITHLQTGSRVGSLRLLTMPDWIREGVADWVALDRPQDLDRLAKAVDRGVPGRAYWDTLGVYPRYRLLVAVAMDRHGWSMEQLLASSMSIEEAARMLHGNARTQAAVSTHDARYSFSGVANVGRF